MGWRYFFGGALAGTLALWPVSAAVAELFGSSADAKNCAQAIAGSVSASTITNICGISPETLDAIVQEFKKGRKTLQDLADERKAAADDVRQILALNEGQMRTALTILGEKNVPREQLATKFVEIAQRFNNELKSSAAPRCVRVC